MSAPTTLEVWRALWHELADALSPENVTLDKTPIDEAHARALRKIAWLRLTADPKPPQPAGAIVNGTWVPINTTGCAAIPPTTIESLGR